MIIPRLRQWFPPNIYLLKVNNRNTEKSCETLSNVSTDGLEGVNICWAFILLFSLVTLKKFKTGCSGFTLFLSEKVSGECRYLKKFWS